MKVDIVNRHTEIDTNAFQTENTTDEDFRASPSISRKSNLLSLKDTEKALDREIPTYIFGRTK